MPLKRLHFSTDILDGFTSLNTGKQRILVFIMARRNMRKPPLRPSNYLSYEDIAEDTGLTADTVRVYILSLKKDGWMKEINRQNSEGKLRFRWTFPKQDDAWQQTYTDETEHEFDNYATEAEANGWLLLEDSFWRVGGELGFQRRGVNSRFWADVINPPKAVTNFFVESAEGFTL